MKIKTLKTSVQTWFTNVKKKAVEGCFHIHLLKVESFSELIENLIVRGGPTGMICDITNSLEANPGPVGNLHKYDVETWSTETKIGLFSEVGDILCPAVKLLKWNIFTYS